MPQQEENIRKVTHDIQNWPMVSRDDFVLHALDCSAIVAITDTRGRILSANDKFVEISGYTRDELIGNDHRMLRSGMHDTRFFRRMYRTIAQGQVWHGEICNRRKNGAMYWVDTTIVPHLSGTGKVTSYVAIRFDITARKRAETHLKTSRKKLQKAVNTDFLTKIPNRMHFSYTLRRLLRESTAGHVCLALLDIDTFKTINDTSGHDSGDRLLRKVATRLEGFEKPGCFIARIGGDEFAILMTGDTPDVFGNTLSTILKAMRFSFRTETMTHSCTVSIGYAAFPLSEAREKAILRRADLALYAAKADGRNRLRRYCPSMEEKLDHAARMRKRIQSSLREQALEVFYQPIVSLRAPSRIAFEALLHWDHPTQNILSPQNFPEIFEDTKLTLNLNDFITRQVMSDIRRLQDEGIRFNRIAVNLSSCDFEGGGFFRKFASAAEKMQVPLNTLALEITENIFARHSCQQLEDELDDLHRQGVQISLDDFGTGFASLTHLKTITFDYVKINRAFVAGLEKQETDAAIIKGVIDIVHSLGRKVVAEGVESTAQIRALLDMGCDYAQGNFLCDAVPLKKIPEVLEMLEQSELLQKLETVEG